MEGLEPLVEWLDHPTWDWTDPLPDAPSTERTLQGDTKCEASALGVTAFNDELFDWTWEPSLNASGDVGSTDGVTAADGREWRAEVNALRAEVSRYKPSIVLALTS